MLSEPQRDLVRDKGTKLGRVLMGLLFFGSGLSMLLMQGADNTAMYFASLGVPLASLVVWLVMATKIFGGLALMLGYRVGLAAAILIGFTFLATAVAHRDFADVNLFKNLAIIGGLLYMMAYGPGGSNTTRLVTKETIQHTQHVETM